MFVSSNFQVYYLFVVSKKILFQMGVCKVTDKILCEFPWARRIPGNDHCVRCIEYVKSIKICDRVDFLRFGI